jgi:glycosyltransferase involved in cell wall biosynthesis
MTDYPLVSIITPAYNRANTIERAVNSVLKQTYNNIELIIIDDGSTDNTLEILEKYKSPSIRIFRHEKNRGVTAAKNSGLNLVKGEWFTILDSDDEIVPEAIETMMKVNLLMDHGVTAVTCNCLDTTKNQFSGTGLTEDQYIDVDKLMKVCKGEFWGITKTSLLENDRFNEKLRGFESIVWNKINERANRYYINKALRIYHTEGSDRIMKSKYDFRKEIVLYENLINEDHFLAVTKKYQPAEYYAICKTGLIVLRAAGKNAAASKYYELLKPAGITTIINLSYKYKIFALLMKNYTILKFNIKPYVFSILKAKK